MPNTTSQPDKHILLHTIPAWGHVKPLTTLIVLMAEARPNVVLTLLVTPEMYTRVNEHLATRLAGRNVLPGRINVIDAFGPPTEEPSGPFPPLDFAAPFKALLHANPIKCHSSGKVYEDLLPVSVAVIDPFCPYALAGIRATAGDKFPVLAWLCVTSVSILRLYGSESIGGIGNFPAKVDAEAAKPENSELTRPQLALKAYHKLSSGELTRVPGLPKMFDYELAPQEHPLMNLEGTMAENFFPFISNSAGIVIASSSVYEPESEAALRQFLASQGKTMFSVGPLAFPNPPREDMPASQLTKEKDISSFLERMQTRFGTKSVIYISFGSLFWPVDPTKVWAFLDELLVQQTPFIFAHSSPFAAIPPAMEDKIKNSGISVTSAWAPQDYILSHPATGWFLTHAGWNSLSESFVHKVPLLLWPFGADQPMNAAVAALQHHIAYELLEVRTGKMGTQKPYCVGEGPMPTFTAEAVREELRGLLVRMKGDEGMTVRRNAEILGDRMSKVWDEGAESTKELNAFLDTY